MKKDTKVFLGIFGALIIIVCIIAFMGVKYLKPKYIESTTLTTTETQQMYSEKNGYTRYVNDDGHVSFLIPNNYGSSSSYNENYMDSQIITNKEEIAHIKNMRGFNYEFTSRSYDHGIVKNDLKKFSKVSDINGYRTYVRYNDKIYDDYGNRYYSVEYYTYINDNLAYYFYLRNNDKSIFDTMVGSYTISY